MVDPTRKGGFLIAAGFLVYFLTQVASWYTSATVLLISIAGTLMIWVGARYVLLPLGEQAKAPMGLVVACLIGAFVTGRIAMGLSDGETVRSFHVAGYVTAAQSLLFTTAGAIPLMTRGSGLVRALSVIALLGVVAYAAFDYLMIENLVAGTWTFEEARAAMVPATFLDTMLFVPALVFGFQQPVPSLANGQPVAPATANPFEK